MDVLFKKPNLMFLIGIRFQSEQQLLTGNYKRDYALFLKLTMLGCRIANMFLKCKRSLTETIICKKECLLFYEKHDLSLFPGDLIRFLNGKVHAEGIPAIEYNSLHDDKRYFNLPPGMIPGRDFYLWRNGIEYWQNNRLHRLDGPARIFRGGEEWFKDGKLHRSDGPALTLEHHDLLANNSIKEIW